MSLTERKQTAVLKVAAVLLCGAISAAAQTGYSNVREYPVPTMASDPAGITLGPDGALWFTEYSNKIGRITTSGAITEYPVLGYNDALNNIVAGPDGALWFTAGSFIGRITTSGVVTLYPAPGYPWGIAAGPDGALWFTEQEGNKIGRMTVAGTITAEYPVPAADAYPEGIAPGPDGALWFTEYRGNQIGRITMSGAIAEYPLPADTEPVGIVTGPDGALWFTGDLAVVGRMTTGGTVSEYLLHPGYEPNGITAGPDGALWFALYNGGLLGRITTNGTISLYGAPTYVGIASGPDGALWFTDTIGDKIGRAPACGIGFSASFAAGTLTMNFDLGIDTPATFDIELSNAGGPIGQPFSQAITAVVPPLPFTINWNDFPSEGSVTVRPTLKSAPGHPICSEWATVDTGQ
jgi:virginiamycin B lyase